MPIIIDLYYLPVLEFFVTLTDHEELIIDDLSYYQKQTYRNRTLVRLANKTEVLSVPVIGGNKKSLYKDIAIDYNQKWVNVHLRGIQSAYGKAPFYEFYFPYLQEVFDKKVAHLWEFNLELLTVCLKLLQLKKKIKLLSEVEITDEMLDLRGLITAKEDYTQRGYYQAHAYHQLFGVNFVSNLSIIDLLFCSGPESREILRLSKKNS